jgi:uncharacterized SAM-binding protein YcdF (DUF218 family)
MTDARQPPAAFPATRLRRRLGLPVLAFLVLAAFWLGGLVWFTHDIPRAVTDADSETDAIVVLTGGSLRVQSGLALLAAGKAKKLFVSGVYHGTDVATLLHVSRQSPDKVACCIVLGYEADNTYGNATETAQWMRQEGFHSLRLVTASYHMPRSLLEFSRAMPEMRIIPHPVFPERVKQRRWWAWPGTASLILAEYHKYLLALVRPLLLGPSESGGSRT